MKNAEKLVAALDGAVAVTWDTCHKIYVIKDADALSSVTAMGYGEEEGSLVLATDDKFELLYTIEDWYEQACELKMVDAISVVDGERVFETLVEQGEDEDEDDEEWED